ncbi:DnaD domain-containing protein [Apilactobacillus xinyiensis]|uniref:DnaD domain-containing protein n=1 Tax=Apilactobacillus xinyiensis TaxID=2841032 RepID=UPI00201056C3|nr:DnaD domain protein [Apilactobacillus xinyiensis]MCL0330652.1 DnaD domain protein [Apilactobacillus xinyiensis]
MVKINKKYDCNYTVIQNSIFEFNEKLPKTEKISFTAIGIFFYLWHLPHDWEFYEAEITNHSSDGIDKFRTGRKELEKYGFVTKTRRCNAAGQVGPYEWTLDDDPEFKPEYLKKPALDFPMQGKPKQEKPTQENPTLQSTNGTKYLNNKVRSSSESDFQKIFTLFEKNVGVVNPLIGQKIKDELQDWKTISPSDYLDIVNYALELAIENTKISNKWRYVEGILDNWEKRQLTTMDKIHNAEELHRKQKESKYKQPYQRKHIKEELPEWARDDYKRVSDEHVDEKKKAEIKAMMKEIDGN